MNGSARIPSRQGASPGAGCVWGARTARSGGAPGDSRSWLWAGGGGGGDGDGDGDGGGTGGGGEGGGGSAGGGVVRSCPGGCAGTMHTPVTHVSPTPHAGTHAAAVCAAPPRGAAKIPIPSARVRRRRDARATHPFKPRRNTCGR